MNHIYSDNVRRKTFLNLNVALIIKCTHMMAVDNNAIIKTDCQKSNIDNYFRLGLSPSWFKNLHEGK